MTRGAFPVAARDLGALMTLGSLHGVSGHPVAAACWLKNSAEGDSVWVNPDLRRGDSYQELWQAVHPGEPIPAGSEVGPMLSPEQAQQGGFVLVRLGLVRIGGMGDRFNGKYLIQGVTHRYSDGTGGGGAGGYTTTLGGRLRH